MTKPKPHQPSEYQTRLQKIEDKIQLALIYIEDGALLTASINLVEAGGELLRLAGEKTRALQALAKPIKIKG